MMRDSRRGGLPVVRKCRHTEVILVPRPGLYNHPVGFPGSAGVSPANTGDWLGIWTLPASRDSRDCVRSG